MYPLNVSTRRSFMRGLAATLGICGLPPLGKAAQAGGETPVSATAVQIDPPQPGYDNLVKLASNENPYGPSEAVMKSMTGAWKQSSNSFDTSGGSAAEAERMKRKRLRRMMSRCARAPARIAW